MQRRARRPACRARSTRRSCEARDAGPGSACEKLAEIPFDFVRKRVSVVVARPRRASGSSPRARSSTCSRRARGPPDGAPLDAAATGRARAPLSTRGARQGIRVLAVATRALAEQAVVRPRRRARSRPSSGFLTFLDRPKEGVRRGASRTSRGSACRSRSSPATASSSRSTSPRLVGLRADRVLTGRGARRAARRGAVARRRAHGPLRRGRSESEGADHPRRSRRWGTSSASSATASTTRRRCTRPTRASRSSRRSTSRGRRPTSSCSSATST